MKTYQIAGFVNHIGEIKVSENGSLYSNIILGRGENEPSYSVALFGPQARLAALELNKGDKIKLTQVRLSIDKHAKNYADKKIANSYSLVAMDWEVVDSFIGVTEAYVENGNMFGGFANNVQNGTTPGGKVAASVLLGQGEGKTSFSFSAYGKAAPVVGGINKGDFIFPQKVMLLPVKDETFQKNNLANRFTLALYEFTVRGQNTPAAQQPAQQRHGTTSQRQQSAPQPQPNPDFDNFDDDIPF